MTLSQRYTLIGRVFSFSGRIYLGSRLPEKKRHYATFGSASPVSLAFSTT